MGFDSYNQDAKQGDPLSEDLRLADTSGMSDEEIARIRTNRSAFRYNLGPIAQILEDPTVQNIEVNGGDVGDIFVERFGTGRSLEPLGMPRELRQALISKLAKSNEAIVDRLHSRLQCDMPYYGCRVQALCEPIADWVLVIRVHAKRIHTLSEYVDTGILSPYRAAFIQAAIDDEANIAVSGPVNSGKTTFLNALIDAKANSFKTARVTVIQDRKELKVDRFRNRIEIMARVEQALPDSNGHANRYTYEFSQALEDALRVNGDSIFWGEVRDGESAHGLMLAMNTGTKGLMMTTHANGCADTLQRLADLIVDADYVANPRQVAALFDVIVFIKRDPKTGQRRIEDVARVRGVAHDGQYIVESIPETDPLAA